MRFAVTMTAALLLAALPLDVMAQLLPQAPAAPTATAAPPRSDLNKILMYRYEVIAGAWYLDQRCHVLTSEDGSKFEKYVGDLNAYAQKEGLAPAAVLVQMQQNGRLGAAQEKFKDCPAEVTNIVNGSYMLAGMLHHDLLEAENQP